MIAFLTAAFPLWVLLASLLALWQPWLFTWFTGPLITGGLAIIMLGMGLTLGLEDARRVADRRMSVVVGFLLQYTVMPAMGWLVAALFQLPTPFAVGLILVTCCPGGTASNVISFLAQVDVALSVAMTALSTLLAVLMTPLLTSWLASSRVEVPTAGLLWSTVQVVAMPILTAALLKRWAPRFTEKILPVSPLAAVIMITMIVASIIGAGRDVILHAGLRLLLAVFTVHTGGFFFGYLLTRLTGHDVRTARTISIEVGMQNSGLGVVLARQNFTDPLVAIPSAISSLFHSLIGSAVAAVWRRSSNPVPASAEEAAVMGAAPRT